MLTDEQIKFIKDSHKYLTATDMADELNLGTNKIWDYCKANGIVPIKVGEQTEKFILENYEKKTFTQLRKILDLSENSLNVYGRKLKIKFIREEGLLPGTKKKQSVRDILSKWQYEGVAHIADESQNEFLRNVDTLMRDFDDKKFKL